jgi:preprotein translocase subunit SecA
MFREVISQDPSFEMQKNSFNYRYLESPFLSLLDVKEGGYGRLKQVVTNLFSRQTTLENKAWRSLERENPWLYSQMRDKVDIRLFADFLQGVSSEEKSIGKDYFVEFQKIRDEAKGWFQENQNANREEKDNYLEKYRHKIYAIARLALNHKRKKRHYDTQIIAGLMMDDGFDVEIPTGEGKTIIVTLPAIMASLEGKGVTIATANEYLAKRDMKEMGPLYSALGLKVAFVGVTECAIYSPNPPLYYRKCTRKEAYEADITYGKMTQFAFDLEADKKVMHPQERVRRYDDHGELIIPALYKDEFDSTEIDESNRALIRNGAVDENGYPIEEVSYVSEELENGKEKGWILVADAIAKQMRPATIIHEDWPDKGKIDDTSGDFYLDEKNNYLGLIITDRGWDKVMKILNLETKKYKHYKIFGKIIREQFGRDSFFEDWEKRNFALGKTGESDAENIVSLREKEPDDASYKIYDSFNLFMKRFLNAMKAEYVFQENKHYFVDPKTKQIVLIDQTTKRASPLNRISEGIHQALEAKHNLPIRVESQIISSTTIANYDAMHDKKAGMTGVVPENLDDALRADNRVVMRMPRRIWVDYLMGTRNGQQVSKEEQLVMIERSHPNTPGIIERFYLPRNKALELQNMQDKENFDWSCAHFERTEYPPQLFFDDEARRNAIVDEIYKMHTKGRPVIVFANSVYEVLKIEEVLLEREKDKPVDKKIVPRTLTALPSHANQEEYIVALSGSFVMGGVTIATTMAGRGTDYKLGVHDLEKAIQEKALEESIRLFDSLLLSSQQFLENSFIALEFQLMKMRGISGKKPEEPIIGAEITELNQQFTIALKFFLEDRKDNGLPIPFGITFGVNSLINFYAFHRNANIFKAEEYVFSHGGMATRLRNDVIINMDLAIKGQNCNKEYLNMFFAKSGYLTDGKVVIQDFATKLKREIDKKMRSLLLITGDGPIPSNLDEEEKQIIQNGGMHVIICNDLDEAVVADLKRIIGQEKGRVRNGVPGSVREFNAVTNLLNIVREDSYYKRYTLDLIKRAKNLSLEDLQEVLPEFLKLVEREQNIRSKLASESRKKLKEYNKILAMPLKVLYSMRNFVMSCSDDELITFRSNLSYSLFVARSKGKKYLVLPEMKIENIEDRINGINGQDLYFRYRKDINREIDAEVIFMLEAYENISDLSATQKEPKDYIKKELNDVFQKRLIDLSSKIANVLWVNS